MAGKITICSSCDGADPAFCAAVKGALPGWDVVSHACLSVCAEPVAVAVQGEGKATYVFAGLTVADTADLVAFAQLYASIPNGWVDDARAAGRLRFCLKTRVPAL